MNLVDQALLAQLITDPKKIGLLDIRPEAFEDQTHQVVATLLRDHVTVITSPGVLVQLLDENGATIDSDTLQNVFEAMPIEAGTIEEVASLWRKVRGQAANRRNAKHLITTARLLENDKITLEDALSRLVGISHVNADEYYAVDGAAIIQRMREGVSATRYPLGERYRLLDAGFRGLDEHGNPTQGIFGAGQIIACLAPSKNGKTRDAVRAVIEHLDAERRVDYYILEDDGQTLVAQILAQKSNIEDWYFTLYLAGRLPDKFSHLKDKIEETLQWFEERSAYIGIFDSANPDINVHNWAEVRANIVGRALTHKTQIVIIDHVQEFGEDYEVQAVIARECRAVIARTGCACLILSQMSLDATMNGTGADELRAKGGNSWAAVVTAGYELRQHPEVGQQELRLEVKVARRARRRTLFVRTQPSTGYCISVKEEPEYWTEDTPMRKEPKRQKKGPF